MPATKGKRRTYISGGQTRADTAAMRAAEALGMKTGGYLPGGFKKRRRKTGNGPLWYTGQEEVPRFGKAGYILRSQKNVDRGDVTIALRMHPSCGTDKTIAYATTHAWPKSSPGWPVPDGAWNTTRPDSRYKSVIVVQAFTAGAVHDVRAFLEELDPAVVNICGNREAGTDYERKAESFLRQCLDTGSRQEPPNPDKQLMFDDAKI